jgi:hypothetical protein
LAAGAVTDFERVVALADRCMTGTERHGSRRWFILAKALTEYRAARHETAIEWVGQFAPRANGTNYDASAFAVLAMAQHQTGRSDAARASLESARAILAKRPPDALHTNSWRDWLHADIFVREAEQMLAARP